MPYHLPSSPLNLFTKELRLCLLKELYHKDYKDLLTVDLFSVYLLSRVDIVIRYIEVDFTFGLPDYVCYIEEFIISRFISPFS